MFFWFGHFLYANYFRNINNFDHLHIIQIRKLFIKNNLRELIFSCKKSTHYQPYIFYI